MIAANRLSMLTIGILLSLAAAAWYLAIVSPWSMAMMEISAPIYMATWVMMLVAMMFPAVAPVVTTFATVSRARNAASPTVPAFVAGYLFIWTAAGLIPLTLYLTTRGAVAGMSATSLGATAIGAVLLVAGVYQFTAWKATCLRACRSPFGIVMNHDFRTGAVGSFRAGVSHGAFCLGCCWALMAVLTVVGLMSLPWMAVLTVIFFAEKNWRHGPGLARVVGATASLAGLTLVAWSLLL